MHHVLLWLLKTKGHKDTMTLSERSENAGSRGTALPEVGTGHIASLPF